MKNKGYFFLIIFLFFTFFSCVKDGNSDPTEIINYVVEGDPVPSFTVTNGQGEIFSSTELVGKRSLLVFFNTDCRDCKTVLPSINNDVWKELKDSPEFLVVTIARGENANTVESYWEVNQYTMPTFQDLDRSVFLKFANNTVPRLYIINEDGFIEWMAIEKLNISTEELIGLIKQ